MSPDRSACPAVATTRGGQVAYVPSDRAPLDGARDIPEERL